MEHGAKIDGLQEQTSELKIKLEDLTSLLKKFEQNSKKQNHEFNTDRKKVMDKIQSDMDELHEKIIVLFEELKKISPSKEIGEISGRIVFLDEKLNLLRKNFSTDIEESIKSNIGNVTSELSLLDAKIGDLSRNIALLPDHEFLEDLQGSILDLHDNIKNIEKEINSLNIGEDLDKINEELVYFNKNFINLEKHFNESDIQKSKCFEQINKNIDLINTEIKKMPVVDGFMEINSKLFTVNKTINALQEQLGQAFNFERNLIDRLEEKLDLITKESDSDKTSPQIGEVTANLKLDSVEKLVNQLSLLQQKLNDNINSTSSGFGKTSTSSNNEDFNEKFKSINEKLSEIIDSSDPEIIQKIEANCDILTDEIKEIKVQLTKISLPPELNNINNNLQDINEYLSLFRNQLDNSLSQENRLLIRIEDKIESIYNKDYSEKTISGIKELKTSIEHKNKEINEKLGAVQQLSEKLSRLQETQLGKAELDKLKKEIDSVAAKFTTIPDELAYINSRFNEFWKSHNESNYILLKLAEDFRPSIDKISGKLDSNLLALNEQIESIKNYLINIDVSENIQNIETRTEEFKHKIGDLSEKIKNIAKSDDLEEIDAKLGSIGIQIGSQIDKLENKISNTNDSSKSYIINEIKTLDDKLNKVSESVKLLPDCEELNILKDILVSLQEKINLLSSEVAKPKETDLKLDTFLNEYNNSKAVIEGLTNDTKSLMTKMNNKLESNLLYLNEQVHKIIQSVVQFDFAENFENLEKNTADLSDKIAADFTYISKSLNNQILDRIDNQENSLIDIIKDELKSISHNQDKESTLSSLSQIQEKLNLMLSQAVSSENLEKLSDKITS